MKCITFIILCTFNLLYIFASEYKSSKVCIDFIKDVEKCNLTAYWDSNGYSIGFGHHGSDVKKGDKITKLKAIKFLSNDIKTSEKYVNYLLNKLPYKYKFTQSFIDGLTSLIYNAGVGNIENSTFYKRLTRCRVCNGVMNKDDWSFTLSAVKNTCISAKGHIIRRQGEYNLMKK